MKGKITRKKMMFAAVATAAFLASGSVAFACLTQKGQLVIDPVSGTTGSTVVGDGSGDMRWCSWPATASTASQSEVVNVAVAPATCKLTSYQLAGSSYEVRLNDSTTSPSWSYDTTTSTWKFNANTGCFLASTNSHKLGSFTVTNGSGNRDVTIPSTAKDSGTNSAAGLCVGNGTDGIFGPLKIT